MRPRGFARALGLGLVLGLGPALFAGCSSALHRRADGFDPRVPLRVAVLPFVDRSTGDAVVSKPLTAVVDLLPILSDDKLTKENAASIFRTQFAGNLHRTPLAMVDLHVVDSLIDHRRMDILAAYDRDRVAGAKALGGVLGADALVFGWVLEWDRDYYGLESAVRAGLRVELRDTTTGGILFESEVRDSKYAGISKVPIAYSPEGAIQSAIVEPLKGLRNTVFATLADDISRASIAGLAPTAEERAAAPAPRIYFVAHSGSGPLRPGDELVVVAVADPGLRATFQVDEDYAPVPMTEGAPGSYRGTLRISPAHPFKGETLRVRGVSASLAASTMTVGRPPIVVAGIASAR